VSKVSQRVEPFSYPITTIVSEAKKLERRGKEIIYLNIGDPPQYGFDVPQQAVKALFAAVEKGHNHYSQAEGDPELRAVIAKLEREVHAVDVQPENVFIDLGSSEGINLIAASLLDPGDEALIPNAWYPSYPNYIRLYNGKPITYRLSEERNWMPDLEDIREKITDRTRFLLICNPNNPTGALYDRDTLRGILEIAAENSLIVVSDEIYERIIFEANFKCAASLAKDVCVIVSNGFSKAYSMTGWRMGWLYIKDPTEKYEHKIRDYLEKLMRTRMCSNTPMQRAGIAVLEGSQDGLSKMIKELLLRRDYVYGRIRDTSGVSAVKPKATFFIFPKIEETVDVKDDEDFVLKLLKEKGVLMVHGTAFGPGGLDHFREVFLQPIEVLEKAHDCLEEFMKEHVTKNK
jgi:aspartate/methionine/tyrosine aminotransferase